MQKYQGLIAAISVAVAAFLAGMRTLPAPGPTPLPTPVVIDQTPKPQPLPPTPIEEIVKPKPVPVDEVIPPSADTPIAEFSITDSAGNNVTSKAGFNQQLIINAAKSRRSPDPSSLLFVIEPAMQQVMVGDLAIITTPSTYSVVKIQEIVALGGKIATKTVMIQIGEVQPNPPTPIDNKPPIPFDTRPPPQPQPVKRSVKLYTIEDPNHRSPEVSMFLEGMFSDSAFKEAGNEWINYDIADQSVGGKAAAAALANTSPNTLPPAVVVRDKTTNVILYVGKMPPSSERVNFLKQYTGGAI